VKKPSRCTGHLYPEKPGGLFQYSKYYVVPYADVSKCYFQLDNFWGIELNLLFGMLASINRISLKLSMVY